MPEKRLLPIKYRERNWHVVCFCLCVGFLVCNEFPFLCSSLLLLSIFSFCWQFQLPALQRRHLSVTVAPVAEWFPLQGFLPSLLLLMFFLRPSHAKLFFFFFYCDSVLYSLLGSSVFRIPASFSGFLLRLPLLLTKLFFLWFSSFSYFVLLAQIKILPAVWGFVLTCANM